MVIYGRNGTGKSSIADAWEWFHTEKIEHLKREGAGPNAYPNRNVTDEDKATYVELDFANDELGTIRLTYKNARITKPVSIGDIEKFRALAPHPCHIRFEDLTRFVYMTKTEKFDALAQLMGFMPQVEMQKTLRRVLKNFNEKIENKNKEYDNTKARLKKSASLDEISAEKFLRSMNQRLQAYKIPLASTIEELDERKKTLNDLVVNDPGIARISLLKTVASTLNAPSIGKELFTLLDNYLTNIQKFLQDEQKLSKLLLLELYEQGEKVLSQNEQNVFSTTSSTEKLVDCPLCGQAYDGDLKEHISVEIQNLRKLKQAREDLEKKQRSVQNDLPQQDRFVISFEQFQDSFDELDKSFILTAVQKESLTVKQDISDLREWLSVRVDNITPDLLKKMINGVENLRNNLTRFEQQRSNSLEKINTELQVLEEGNKQRSELVEDNNSFGQSVNLWSEIKNTEAILNNLSHVSQNFQSIVDDYIAKSIDNVKNRFNIISDDVETYFAILEQDTKGLTKAKLKLLPGDDRAVELQIEFHGETIHPAYKYLSESQLNSFGLSVFLASTKYFNSKFQFIILDDIINSFDGYKRPLIVKLLKDKFPNHQILLLTHDNVWADRLFESFPTAVKKRFQRWEYNHGPFMTDGFAPLDKIKKHIDNDEPIEAGRNMGPYLERQLQEMGENFGILVQYNRQNE